MKLKEQVVSLELATKLKNLGVEQESYFVWYQAWGGIWCLGDNAAAMNNAVQIGQTTAFQINECSAFTVAELGEMLGAELTDANESDSFTLKCGNAIDFWWATFGNDEADVTPQFENVKFADVLAELMIFLIEEKLIDAKA